MIIHIKNMCCPRCITAVRAILDTLNITAVDIGLGDVVTKNQLTQKQLSLLAEKLQVEGFELLDDPRSQLVEHIRLLTIEWVRMKSERPKLSEFLSARLSKDYSLVSKLFSEVRGMTIEHFTILHRIEYAKELLRYGNMSTSEVAYTLGYSSPAHLSSQFKQVTGMTPKAFRGLKANNKIDISQI